MLTAQTRIEDTAKINKRIVPALKRLGIRTIRDLLFHFPSRYDDFSSVKPIADVAAGETVTIRGMMKKMSVGRTARKHISITQGVIEDETGRIKALWFHQPFLVRNLKEGDAVCLSGKVALGKTGLFLSNPAYEKTQNIQHRVPSTSGIHTGGLVPVYPETEGISSRWMRFLISSYLPLAASLQDIIPSEIKSRHDFPDVAGALNDIHFPETKKHADRARSRFIFEELLLIQLRALKERSRLKRQSAPEIPTNIQFMKQLVSSLPFTLTNSQRKAMWDILTDIAKPHPMNRLLEGDVGSGKTVVAAAAALTAARAGYQTAFMAPTEILARQHYATLASILVPFDIFTALITGSEKQSALTKQCHVFVGTHALIQKTVHFENLGLVIIDEQHRFGVEQRAALLRNAKRDTGDRKETSGGAIPHFLSMSATPIPRTLALAIYGDLDISILDEVPGGRLPVITKIVDPASRNETYDFIKDEIRKGGQAFVVCPRIEIKDLNASYQPSATGYQQKLLTTEVKAVKQEYEKLSHEIFPKCKIAMLHGKLKPKEKQEIMRSFQNREIDILVSTSVIEVGVDVPNANVMVIEGAERFGLAQLHQFRGRVGRGGRQSYCFLFPSEDAPATRHLRALISAKNGFELAEKDLAIRGPGSMFGTRQWGISDISADALRDMKLIETVRGTAIELAKKDPALAAYPLLRERLETLERDAHLE